MENQQKPDYDKLNEGLTLAQIFHVKVLEGDISRASAEQLRFHLLEAIRYQYRQSNIFVALMKGSLPPMETYKKDGSV